MMLFVKMGDFCLVNKITTDDIGCCLIVSDPPKNFFPMSFYKIMKFWSVKNLFFFKNET